MKYLTKWIEAKVVKSTNSNKIVIFLYKNIIVRFGSPKILISNRRIHFLNEIIKEILSIFTIQHQKITLYHPQTNRAAEQVNQMLVKILCKTVVDNKKGWSN